MRPAVDLSRREPRSSDRVSSSTEELDSGTSVGFRPVAVEVTDGEVEDPLNVATKTNNPELVRKQQ